MSLVRLSRGQVLHEPGSPLPHLCFPVSGLIALLNTLDDDDTTEVGVVGNDGCVGVHLLLGGETVPWRAIVQIPGFGYRIDREAVLSEFHRGGPTQRLLLRYIETRLTLISQIAACNRHHTIEQRVSRWLLLALDRVPFTQIEITQEAMGKLLGARRTSIAQATTKLQEAGLIEYRRGRIRVSDRARLASHACECYGVVRTATERLLTR